MLADGDAKKIKDFFARCPQVKKGAFYRDAIIEKITRESVAEAEARR